MAKVLEVVLNQSYFAQQCVNRWHYIMNGTPVGVTGSFALTYAMGAILTGDPLDLPAGGFFSVLQDLQNSQVVFEDLLVRSVYDSEDFYTYAWTTPITGGVSGGGVSPSVAFGFNTNRVRQDIRRGQKRFVGVSLSDDANGGLFAGTVPTRMNAMAASMSESLFYNQGGNNLTFEPAILKKKAVVLPNGNTTYRYWPTEAEQLAFSVTGITWERKTTSRTQGSRQYGRGA